MHLLSSDGRLPSFDLLKTIECFHGPFGRATCTLGIGSSDESSRSDGIVVKGVHRRAIVCSSFANRFHDEKDIVRFQFIEDVQDNLALNRKSSDSLLFDNRLTGLGVDYSWENHRSVAYSRDDAAPTPDVYRNALKSSGGRVVIESRMTGGSKEQPILFLLQIRCFLQLRIQLHIERMLRVLEDRLVVAR